MLNKLSLHFTLYSGGLIDLTVQDHPYVSIIVKGTVKGMVRITVMGMVKVMVRITVKGRVKGMAIIKFKGTVKSMVRIIFRVMVMITFNGRVRGMARMVMSARDNIYTHLFLNHIQSRR